jgi:hypothetical protein
MITSRALLCLQVSFQIILNLKGFQITYKPNKRLKMLYKRKNNRKIETKKLLKMPMMINLKRKIKDFLLWLENKSLMKLCRKFKMIIRKTVKFFNNFKSIEIC